MAGAEGKKLLDSGYILKAESTELACRLEIEFHRKGEVKSDYYNFFKHEQGKSEIFIK